MIELDDFRTFEVFDQMEFLREAESRVYQSPSVLLLSGGQLRPGDENRYSIFARDPFLVLSAKNDRVRIETESGVHEFSADCLAVLEKLCQKIRPDFDPCGLPFSGGAVGYLSYDLKNRLEKLPQTARDDLGLPDLFLLWPGRIDVYDRKSEICSRIVLRPRGSVWPLDGFAPEPFAGRLCRVDSIMAPVVRFRPQSGSARFETGPLESNFTHEGYLSALGRVREYIRRGDVYQVNLSQRFEFPFKGDPFGLWKSLFEINPAPFYAFVNAGDHQVLSTSMERFLFQRGNYMETRPIKGTRKRGKTLSEDEELKADLVSSSKDDAELSMIVDLLRNDLGRICRAGTVEVAEHKRLETYENVHHLVSIVTGELRPETTPCDIIRATFPGGSITGCPKIRAMEIIDELEPDVRHVYTGAIGYIGWHNNLDLNVAIRTAILKEDTCYYSAGGGVIYDSVEEDEYQETFHKARTLLELIEKSGSMP